MMLFLYLLSALLLSSNCHTLDKITYEFSKELIDAVIPCHPKDINKIDHVIDGIRKNVENINRIIVISEEKYTDKAEWFDEKNYPFTKETVALEIFPSNPEQFTKLMGRRIGWIYQQLLKFYAPLMIPNISSNVLIVCADTIFLRSVRFQEPDGSPLLSYNNHIHTPYFVHGAKLVPGFRQAFEGKGGTVHHSFFQRPVIKDFFNIIESVHGLEVWKAMCRTLDHSHVHGAAMSEYELYFNFIFLRSNQPKLRLLRYTDAAFNMHNIASAQRQGLNYISCHHYIKKEITNTRHAENV